MYIYIYTYIYICCILANWYAVGDSVCWEHSEHATVSDCEVYKKKSCSIRVPSLALQILVSSSIAVGSLSMALQILQILVSSSIAQHLAVGSLNMCCAFRHMALQILVSSSIAVGSLNMIRATTCPTGQLTTCMGGSVRKIKLSPD